MYHVVLGRAVIGFLSTYRPTGGGLASSTVGQLADQAAATTGTDADTVTRFLQAGGHSPATIENVVRCLGLEGTTEPAQDERSKPLPMLRAVNSDSEQWRTSRPCCSRTEASPTG